MKHDTCRWWLLLAAAILVSACAAPGHREVTVGPGIAYAVSGQADLFSRFAPVVIPDATTERYNRLGSPAARLDKRGREHIYIDPDKPAYFIQERRFVTSRGQYTNLIYRIHFEKVPQNLLPFHLTAGRNVGLLIIVTLDHEQRPLLITTVHTCGCYLAFTPTSHMPPDAFPEKWNMDGQTVFGMKLPGRLNRMEENARPVIYLASGTHRVRDVRIMPVSSLADRYRIVVPAIQPMAALKRLPLGDGTTSFFETDGPRKGYVKGSHKPWEFLLMSWWVMDARIGEDKEYGDATLTGTTFYTDLNPAHRQDSDMWPFARFLAYWGWRL